MSPKKTFFSRLKHLRGDHRAKDSEKSKRKDDDPQSVVLPTVSATSSKRIQDTWEDRSFTVGFNSNWTILL